MPGPTTEVLNEDIKELKAEIRDIRDDLSVVKSDIHNVATGLAELRAEFRVITGLAKWASALLVTTILTSGAAGIWWASSLATQVRLLENRFDKLETRFDKFEASLNKLVEQGRPSQPAAPANEKLSERRVDPKTH